MHIAICDDNIADRKQLERLLKREADRRASELGGLYVDSYGHLEALMRSPMLYDAFFIDMCKGETTGMDIVNQLTKAGVTAPLILCSSDIYYPNQGMEGSNLQYLDKPILTKDLSHMLDLAHDLKASVIPHIELREESGNHLYVAEEEILYAVSAGNYLKITLTDGQTLSILSTIENLYSQLSHYPALFPVNNHTLVNGRHISRLTLLSVTMTGGKRFFLSPTKRSYAKYALKKFQSI